MAIENPFLKQKAVSYNFDPKLPIERNIKEDLNKSDLPKEKSIGYSSMGITSPSINIKTPELKLPDTDDTDIDISSKKGTNRFGKKAGTAGISALQELPNVINNLTTKPETEEAATGKVLSLASSGASIGSAFGPWGTLAGAGVGAITGILDNAGWQQDLVEKKDDAAIEEDKNNIAERQQNYFLNKTAEQIKAERNLFAQSQGLLT